jgi:hypothetical protein
MIRHRWNKDNVCSVCGIARMRVPYKKWIRTYGKLRNGVFEDRNVYQYGTAWWYGAPVDPTFDHLFSSIGFERPECKNKNHEQ